ncbi:AAA family ATPase [Streptomyces dysideae]|uniref:AAA family ATPase n=1 Tax=Streptomyces dysideae TaxID=909626 RepID=A0A124IEP3_9ACTN|nr:MoxR family ATPase [Streptomyces dysideae]KUO18937.1 AAA family ATPase [Streptomyces dysideae]
MTTKPDWWVYEGTGTPHDGIDDLPDAPPWRAFRHGGAQLLEPPQAPDDDAAHRHLGREGQGIAYQAGEREKHLVNLALHLRRPLLLTGKPGTGKSTLAYAVAHELKLGPVLRWNITSRTTLKDGLYEYDAVGRLYDAGLRNAGTLPNRDAEAPEPPAIGEYMWLGPLGTALLPWRRPRVLLIDEIDKSDMDFPNDLLNVFEEGEFVIPELARLGGGRQDVMTADRRKVGVSGGEVACAEFPFVVLTSNEEREFPMAFLRRCVRLEIGPADKERLAGMVAAHLGPPPAGNGSAELRAGIIAQFLARQRETGALANDQLLNALLMAERGLGDDETGRALLGDDLLRPLDRG